MASSSSSSPATTSLAYPHSSKTAGGGDDLLTADLGKNDYDWLLTPPGSPPTADAIDQQQISSEHSGHVDDLLSAAALPNLVRSLAAIKTSRIAGSKAEPSNKKDASSLFSTRLDPSLRSSWGTTLTRSSSTAAGSPFSAAAAANGGNNRRGSLPGNGSLSRPSSRPSTPTKLKSSPFSLSSSSSSCSATTTTSVSRPTTPTSRSKPSSSRPTTPTNRNSSRIDSSFRPSPSPSPAARPSSLSRPATPVRRPSSVTPPPPSPSARSSSVNKGRPMPSRSTPASLNSSPTLKPVAAAASHHHAAWEQLSAIPGFNLEPPPNLRTTNAPRSSSNSRGSTVGGSLSRVTSSGPNTTTSKTLYDGSDVSTRRSSPSPARTRSTAASSSNPIMMMTRSNSSKPDRSSIDSSVSTRSMKMLDSKLNAPSRRSISSSSPDTMLAGSTSHMINVAVKPLSPTAGRDGHGSRSFFRKPIEFSAWNKDIRAGTSSTNGLHSLVSNVPASSLYSVRPAGVRAQPDSFPTASDSAAYSRNGGYDPEKEFVSEFRSKELVSEFSSSKVSSAVGEFSSNKSSVAGGEYSSNSSVAGGEYSSKTSFAGGEYSSKTSFAGGEYSSKTSFAGGEFSSSIKPSPANRVDNSFSSLLKDTRLNDWLGSPEYRNEHHTTTTATSAAAVVVEQVPLGQVPSSNVAENDAPVTCRHGSVASSCELCMMKLRLQRLTEKCRASLTASFQVSNNIFKSGFSGSAVSSGHR